MTLDNGTEFTEHEYVQQKAKLKTYFCDPYSSWQRGANENCDMLLRGYLPKRHDISTLKQSELNNRPRKRSDFRTPNEMYQLQLQKGLANVAVGTRI